MTGAPMQTNRRRYISFSGCALAMLLILPAAGCGGTGAEPPSARQGGAGTAPDHAHAAHAHGDHLPAGDHADYSIFHL
jgi:hypothetical protein